MVTFTLGITRSGAVSYESTALKLKARGPRRTTPDTGSPVLGPASQCVRLGTVTPAPRSVDLGTRLQLPILAPVAD